MCSGIRTPPSCRRCCRRQCLGNGKDAGGTQSTFETVDSFFFFKPPKHLEKENLLTFILLVSKQVHCLIVCPSNVPSWNDGDGHAGLAGEMGKQMRFGLGGEEGGGEKKERPAGSHLGKCCKNSLQNSFPWPGIQQTKCCTSWSDLIHPDLIDWTLPKPRGSADVLR